MDVIILPPSHSFSNKYSIHSIFLHILSPCNLPIVSKLMKTIFFTIDSNYFCLVLILLITSAYAQIIFSFETIDQIPSRECLSKTQLSQILKRDRRASISRSYFHHWQQTRDNSRYTVKNSLAFSPRLGKRADDTLVYRSNDFDNFLIILAGQLQEKQIDIVYEDSTKICLSQPISDTFIQEIIGQVDRSRRSQGEQEKEETHGRQTIGKHPVLFRYRLG